TRPAARRSLCGACWRVLLATQGRASYWLSGPSQDRYGNANARAECGCSEDIATQAETYRAKALECEWLGSSTKDTEIKNKLLPLVAQWRESTRVGVRLCVTQSKVNSADVRPAGLDSASGTRLSPRREATPIL